MLTDLHEAFEAANPEHSKFDRIPVTDRPSTRPDLCAFLRLDKLMPGDPTNVDDLISYARHEEFYLSIDPHEFAKVATQEDVVYLVRCGVGYDVSEDGFYMFT